MLEPTVRTAIPMQTPSNKLEGSSPCDGCNPTSLDVIRDKLHLCRIALDIDVIIADTDATIAQLLAL